MKVNLKKITLGAITAMTLLATGAFAGQANAASYTVKPGQTFLYKVDKGDTLYYLAKHYGTTVADIEKLNHMQSAWIEAGQNILISVGKNSTAVSNNHASVLSYSAPTVAGTAYKEKLNMVASAYGPNDETGPYAGYAYDGAKLHQGIIAVDPNVIPLGSKVFVTGYNNPNLPQGGFYATAEDIGGAIKGNRIDIYLNTGTWQVQQFGLQNVKVYVLK